MQQPKHILSCDWGTSSFRLRLIDTASQTCLAKAESDKGNASLFNQWKAKPDSGRIQYYLEYLKAAINDLKERSELPVNDLPLLISGMASSSVGMKELPYAGLPFMLDGTSAYSEWINGAPVLSQPILLISGAHQPDDVMRGEETQLVGLTDLLHLSSKEESLFILPGTHSKHITVNNNRIVHFNTFMTGEVFDILARHSILGHAIDGPESRQISDDDKKPFWDGVNKALGSELLGSLFSVRINQLKKYLSPQQNYFYLSGLLIGSETKYLQQLSRRDLILCSSGNLQRLYQWALDCAGLLQQTTVVPPETLDYAATAGQLKIYTNMASKKI